MKIAAGTAAAVAVVMRTTVATSPRVAGAVAAHGASVADVLAGGGPDHRRGARLTTCPAGLCHGFHLYHCRGGLIGARRDMA